MRRKYTSSLMGHLAERYRDASRSGVYRVSDAAIPRLAALEAGSAAQVLIIEGLDALAAREPEAFRALVEALERVAAGWRERGTPFFAVLNDPRRQLSLPTLYKEQA